MKKWKTILALILMAFATYFNWGWFWALLIILGLLHVLSVGEIHFVEAVNKKETPILYWLMVAIWSLFACYQIGGHLG